MRSRRAARLARVIACVVALDAGAAGALGRPDWAKPFLARPTPAGDYIAQNDSWVVVYGEVEFALRGERGIEQRTRSILENRTGREEPFETSVVYDEGQDDLSGLALAVQRTVWHDINLSRKAVTASVPGSTQVVVAGAEAIGPGRRVAFEYTLTDRLGFNPWRAAAVPRAFPIAEIRYAVEPDSASHGLRLDLELPPGNPLPSTFLRAADGSWTVTQVPAESRITPSGLVYQPAATDLYPYFLARSGDTAGSFRAYVQHYRQAWEDDAREMDSGRVAALAAQLTGGVAGLFEKAARLAAFVQHEVQYDDSNERSINAWVPLPTQETLRSMKADCKGKVMLLQALLARVGVTATPVLLRFNPAYFTWGEQIGSAFLNHVVIAVDLRAEGSRRPATLISGPAAGWVLFDPTVEAAGFGSPMPRLEGLPALFVGGADDPRFEIQTYLPSAASIAIRLSFELDASSHAQIQATVNDNGQSSLVAGLCSPFNAERSRRVLAQAFAAKLGEARVSRYDIELPKPGGNGACVATGEITLQQPLQEMASSSLLTSPLGVAAVLAGLPNGFQPQPPPKAEDKAELHAPWDARQNTSGALTRMDATVSLVLPLGLEWVPPPPRREARPWLSYELSWVGSGEGRWTATLHLEVPRGRWPAGERSERLKLMDELLSGLYAPFILAHRQGE